MLYISIDLYRYWLICACVCCIEKKKYINKEINKYKYNENIQKNDNNTKERKKKQCQ